MRQFITWQFWLSLAVLAALVGGLLLVTGHSAGSSAGSASIDGAAVTLPESANADALVQIDLIGLVFAAQADQAFQVVNGKAIAKAQIRIDGTRAMTIMPGTPGENRCAELDALAKCAVAAHLLGDAVLWFSFLPLGDRNTVTLPAIRTLLPGKRVVLANGWSVNRGDVIKRVCATETSSLSDFIRRFGDTASSTFSLDAQQITTVACPA